MRRTFGQEVPAHLCVRLSAGRFGGVEVRNMHGVVLFLGQLALPTSLKPAWAC